MNYPLLETILQEAQIQTNVEMADALEKAVRKHFPKSFLSVKIRGVLGGSDPVLQFTLGKGKADWPNGIINNDPIHTMIFFNGFNREGMLLKGKVQADMSQGDTFRINGQPQVKFKWRNATATPESIVKKVDQYFGKIKKWLNSPEGKEAQAKFKERF